MEASLFQCEYVFTDELLLAVPRSLVPDAAKEGALSCGQVAEGRFREPDAPLQPLGAFRETPFLILTESNQLRERSLAICEEHGLAPSVRFYVEQLETAWHFARHGLGAAFVTNLIVAETMDDGLAYFRLSSPHAVRHFHAVMRKNTFISRIMRNFIALVLKKGGACLP